MFARLQDLTPPRGCGSDIINGPQKNCADGDSQCAYYAFHDPPLSRAVDVAEIAASIGPSSLLGWCSL